MSPEFKDNNEFIYYIPGDKISENIDFEHIRFNFNQVDYICENYRVTAISAVKYGGLLESLAVMSFGNRIGAHVEVSDIASSISGELGGFLITSPSDIPELQKIGQTISEFTLIINDVKISGSKLLTSFEGKLDKIYPTEFEQKSFIKEVPEVKVETNKTFVHQVSKPLVYIPVFPGTNSEYDSAKAFEQAGAEVTMLPFITLDEESIQDSVTKMASQIDKSHILFFAGGFSAADEPDGSAKFIVNILLNDKVRQSIDNFIARGGLIIGICNGFQALVKSGLLPYGNFESMNENSPTLFYNDANQHVSKMVDIRIANTNSPWLSSVQTGDIFTIPVSHGEGKFVVSEEEFRILRDNGQIFSQYVDFSGKPSMDSKFNPNGSTCAIEGITSRNGQILGKMGHSERVEEGLFQNIPGAKDQQLFVNAVKYFTEV